jgi:hypothetical protein
MEEAHRSNSPEDRRKAVHNVSTSGRHAVVVSDDDGVVDGVEEDEAKMLDTFSVLGTASRGR